MQIQVFNQFPILGIGKCHIFQIHTAFRLLDMGAVRRIGAHGLPVDEVKDTLRAGQGVLKLGDYTGDLIKRLGILVCVA